MITVFKQLEDEKTAELLLKEYTNRLYYNGGKSSSDLEVLAHIKLKYPKLFVQYEQQILLRMGLFFKNPKVDSFEDMVFEIYGEYIKEQLIGQFTPAQADIIELISKNKVISFSSPTSTGKSHVFRYLIKHFEKDIVIIVPSRALINEYQRIVHEIIDDKTVNVMTFVDKINTKRTTKNIFIITPERTRDLFNLRESFNVDLMLFDEAQLGDDKGLRGLYYDSVIRRAIKYFTDSKFVFAYPFVNNPEAQFVKNKIDFHDKAAKRYDYRNVGQIFYTYEPDENDKTKNAFYNFGTDLKLFGKKIKTTDPLKEVLENNKTALIYCPKQSIYKREVFRVFRQYIDLCKEITAIDALELIEKVREYIGASKNSRSEDYWSLLITLMKRGIIIHHGSLPLKVRMLIEEFTNKGFCRICFATSTLTQGINMPFELLWIYRSEWSKPLDMKNLIGRTGRSSIDAVFDIGKVIVKDATKLRNLLATKINIDNISQLDVTTDVNDDYKEYKEAIKNGTFSEEYNMSNAELERINSEQVSSRIKKILDKVFQGNNFVIPIEERPQEEDRSTEIEKLFRQIYQTHLNRADNFLSDGEQYILNTVVKILFWRVEGKRFSEIVQKRYSYTAATQKRKELREYINANPNEKCRECELENIPAMYLVQFYMIPNRKIIPLNLTHRTKAKDVDYDRVIMDTYDFIDKLIGFRVGDVYFAAFNKFSTNVNYDELDRQKAKIMCNYIRYGTDDEKEIWLLRYGFEFEDFDWLKPIVKSVSEEEIVFNDILGLNDEQKKRIERFL